MHINTAILTYSYNYSKLTQKLKPTFNIHEHKMKSKTAEIVNENLIG